MSGYTTTGDGLIAALQLLAVVKRLDKPVSEVCHCFEPLPQILKNVRYKAGKPLLESIVLKAIEAGKERLGSNGRLVIRASGTEPVIRVMAEGDNGDLVNSVVDDVVDAVTRRQARSRRARPCRERHDADPKYLLTFRSLHRRSRLRTT